MKIKEYKRILFIEAEPKKGFNFGYYLIINHLGENNKLQLIGECNNTSPQQTTEENLKMCLNQVLKNNLLYKHMSNMLNNSAVVYPTFLRPYENNDPTLKNIDTHSLTSQAISSDRKDIKRVDRQFAAMIAHAKKTLKKLGYETTNKIIMKGFSSSAKFAQRFAFLYPELVSAVIAGGISAILCLPVNKYKNHTLNFPLGTNNYEQLTGKKFDKKTFNKIPHYVFMGEKDQNDPLPYSDSFTDEERKILISITHKNMQTRWNKMLGIIKELKLNVYPYLMPGIEHSPRGIPEIMQENLLLLKKQIARQESPKRK